MVAARGRDVTIESPHAPARLLSNERSGRGALAAETRAATIVYGQALVGAMTVKRIGVPAGRSSPGLGS